MISILLFLGLLFAPDGIDAGNKGKAKGIHKSDKPFKDTQLVSPGNGSVPTHPATTEGVTVQKLTTPAHANIQLGISSSYVATSNGDSTQKLTYEPLGNLTWVP